jgi:hypothetical protein
MIQAILRLSRVPEALRAAAWWLALISAIVVVRLVTLPWADNHPPVPLLTGLSWGCFLAVSSLLVVLARRRRQLLHDRPSLPLAVLSVCLLVALSLWFPLLLPDILSFNIYFLCAGAFHLMTFVLLALLLSPIAFRASARYFFLIERIGLFSMLLLLTGAILNAAWMVLVYQRLYYSQDTLVDCYAFIPFGQWVLDQEWGGKTGALLAETELWHLQALWLLFAALAWGTAALVYRRLARLFAAT